MNGSEVESGTGSSTVDDRHRTLSLAKSVAVKTCVDVLDQKLLGNANDALTIDLVDQNLKDAEIHFDNVIAIGDGVKFGRAPGKLDRQCQVELGG